MSSKTDKNGGSGVLGEIRSFVYTVVVIAVAFAFLSALWSGGLDGAEGWVRSAIDWFFALCQSVIDAVTGLSRGAAA